MKQFWMKNRYLFTAVIAVIGLGVLFFGSLLLWKDGKMRDAGITTLAVRANFKEAGGTGSDQADSETAGRIEPTPTPLSPDSASNSVLEMEWRFKDVFPRICNIYSFEAKTWKQGDPVKEDLSSKAKEMTRQICAKYLNREVGTEDLSVVRYTDEAGYRDNILRITNSKQDFVCCLREKDLGLLVIDNAVLSVTNNKLDMQKDAERIAAFFGTTLGKSTLNQGGTQDMTGTWVERCMSYELADGRFVSLCYYLDTLHGIQIHEDEASAGEMVCFKADVRYDESIVHLVQEASFIQGDLEKIAEGDMTPEQAEALYRNLVSAANSRAVERRKAENLSIEQLDYNLKPGEITYFLDESGYRENYYHIEKKGLISIDIAAGTGFIVRAKCNALYNLDPDLDLRDIPYEQMGEEAYEAYMQNIADKVFGKDKVDRVQVNAVYDGNYCTMDIEMKDGSWYEFGFTGGKLMYIEYYATSRIEMPGWGADNLYINTATGEEFYREF